MTNNYTSFEGILYAGWLKFASNLGWGRGKSTSLGSYMGTSRA